MKVKTLQYNDIIKLIGKRVRFTSNCEFFPFFNVIGTITNINFSSTGEYIFIVNVKNKQIKIGSNMKNLDIELIS